MIFLLAWILLNLYLIIKLEREYKKFKKRKL